MKSSTRSNLSHLFHGLAWLLFALAGLAFWFGGGVVTAVAKIDRFTGELIGIGLAAVFAALGVIAKSVEDHIEIGEEGDGPTSLGEALRK